MMEKALITKMGKDLYLGNSDPSKLKFSQEESQNIFTQTLQKEAVERSGLAWSGTFTYADHYSNPMVRWNLFNLVAETLQVIIPATIKDQFDPFVETRNTNWGDRQIFNIGSPDLFAVSKMSMGNRSAARQRLDSRSLTLYPVMREVKIYEDLYSVLAGRMNWAEWVSKVQLSMTTQIKTDIYNAIYNSYSALEATYQASGSFVSTTFTTMVQHVSAVCGGLKPVCYGSQLALAKVVSSAGFTGYPGFMSQNMLDRYNEAGFLGKFQGTDLVMLEQAHIPGASTDTFAISDNFLLIVPQGVEKIVKMVFEGGVLVDDNSANRPVDDSIELSVRQAWDVGTLSSAKYGIYQIS